MLTHQEAVDLQRFVDAVKASLPGYRESEQQREMMSAIADTFDRCLHGSTVAETDGANILICESGTGTGKTFAYAIPGLVLARSVGKKLVISSSTVALQEQLAAKDLAVSAVVFAVAVQLRHRQGPRPVRLQGAARDRLGGRTTRSGSRTSRQAAATARLACCSVSTSRSTPAGGMVTVTGSTSLCPEHSGTD